MSIFPEWIEQVVGRKLFDGFNEVVDLCFPWPAVAEELSMDVLLWEVLSGQVDGGLRPLSGRFAQKIAHDIDQQFLFGVKTVKYGCADKSWKWIKGKIVLTLISWKNCTYFNILLELHKN